MSVRRSMGLPWICSGDMYAGVPTTAPAWVLSESVRSVSVMRATPKSVSFTRPCESIITLAGLMSRWMMLASCAKCSASHNSAMMCTTSFTSKRSLASKKDLSSLPRTISITMYATSPSSAKSNTWTMLGWFSRATACASRAKRIEYSLADSESSALFRIVLIATLRCRRVSMPS